MNTAEMNAPERTAESTEDPSVEGRPVESHGHMVRRRTLTLLTIVLLIGIPAGYLVISANQSRDAGKDKQARYTATGLMGGAPSHVLRRLYNVPLPDERSAVSYYETNNWKTSRLYVQFLTTNDGLDEFLTAMGTSLDELRKDYVPVGARDRRVTGWDFTGVGDWQGLIHHEHDPHPTQRIVVNLSNPRYAQVYVVSTTTP